MITVMNHVSFTVADLKKEVEFYQNVLGLECISYASRDQAFSAAVTGIPGVEMNIAYMKAPNCSLELIQYTAGEGEKLVTATNQPGCTHLCFSVSDYDNWISRMKQNNVRMSGELCIVPAGPNKGRKVCYMLDPEGNHLEFIEDNNKNV